MSARLFVDVRKLIWRERWAELAELTGIVIPDGYHITRAEIRSYRVRVGVRPIVGKKYNDVVWINGPTVEYDHKVKGDCLLAPSTLCRELRNVYGPQGFGSGGGYGFVLCCDNCVSRGIIGDHFGSGPARVMVIDPTRPASFRAVGGDHINAGREWRESGQWDPDSQAWTSLAARMRPEAAAVAD